MNQTLIQPEGIGGWLVVVALALIVSPFIQLDALGEQVVAYNTLIIPSGRVSLTLSTLIFTETFVTGVFLTWACINIYLFLKKKSAFKNAFAGFLCINWLFVVADLVAAELVVDLPVTSDELMDVTRRFIGVLIWVTYIYRSKRVKNTFIHEDEGNKVWKIQGSVLALGGIFCLMGMLLSPKVTLITERILIIQARNITESMGGQIVAEGVRSDGAGAVGMTFTYDFTLLDHPANEWNGNEVIAFFRPSALEAACSDLGGWLETGVTVQFQYAGNDQQQVAILDIRDIDCPGHTHQASEDGENISPRDIAANAKSSFVSVTGYVGGEPTANGSGFIVRQDGVFVTNLHVLQDAETLSVKLPNGEIYNHVFVLDMDEPRDLAILKIPATGLSALRIGDDRLVEVGDTVYALGNPLGLDQTFTDGILSARRVIDGIERLQISAPISLGSSGGPILNSSGEVIGVATAFMPDGQNLNIAMPSHYVSGMLAVSKEPKPFEELARLGAFSAPETVAERNSEYVELLETIPVELRAGFEAMKPWQRQAAARGLIMGYAIEDLGWEEMEMDFEWGVLAPGELDSFDLALEDGEYLVFGVCDNDCTDFDLGVVVEDEERLTDEELDANPTVTFSIPSRMGVTIYRSMETCATENCGFWVRLYRQRVIN